MNGLTFTTDGEVVSTPDAELIDLDEIPVELPYDLLELGSYPTLQAGRVHMQTSRGCPQQVRLLLQHHLQQAQLARQEPAARRR